MIHDVQKIIQKFGGPGIVARSLNLAPGTVTNWQHRERHIPASRFLEILDLAENRGIDVTLADFYPPRQLDRVPSRRKIAA